MTENEKMTVEILNDLVTLTTNDIKEWHDECKEYFGENSPVMDFVNKASTLVLDYKTRKVV